MSRLGDAKNIKNRIRISIYQRRYSGNQLWKYLGYIYDVMTMSKRFVLTKQSTSILIEKNKAIFFYIPKVASTSLLKVFSTIAYGKEMQLHDVPKLKEHELRMYQDYYKFAIVRNPYDRLLSCYHDKILLGGINFGKDTNSFSDFAVRVCSIPDKHSNIHFKSQHKFITNREGSLWTDYVGKFENLDQEYDKICRELGVQSPPNLRQHNKSKRSKPDYRQYYDEQTKRLVTKRYQKDLRLFDYKF